MKEHAEATGEWIERLRSAAMKAITEDDLREIFQRMVQRAKTGDAASIRMLMTYMQPPPPPALPQLNPPAQRVNAKVVNIYAGGRRKKTSKLLSDGALTLEHRNGKPS